MTHENHIPTGVTPEIIAQRMSQAMSDWLNTHREVAK